MADSSFASAPVDSHPSAAPLEPSIATHSTSEPVQHQQSFVENIQSTAQSTMSSIQNHPTVQSVTNGPVAQNVKAEANKTGNEFQNLANARTVPNQPAATGQDLTHYHSMFYSLLSWENPRATGISFASVVGFILAARYLNIISYLFKLTAYALAITATAEVTGKLVFNSGFSTRLRPRKYYTIPREALESSLEDVEQLINFFVIEAQRILFAENIFATIAAFAAAVISYGLIAIVPFWGLTLIGTCVVFLAPLIYVSNKEQIDQLLNQASDVAASQANQLRDPTAQHTGAATEQIKRYTGEYTALAQDYLNARKSNAPAVHKPVVSSADFPTAPKVEPQHTYDAQPAVAAAHAQEPLLS